MHTTHVGQELLTAFIRQELLGLQVHRQALNPGAILRGLADRRGKFPTHPSPTLRTDQGLHAMFCDDQFDGREIKHLPLSSSLGCLLRRKYRLTVRTGLWSMHDYFLRRSTHFQGVP